MKIGRAAFALLFALALSSLGAQSLRTMRAEFTRIVQRGGIEERVEGTLFYKAPSRIILVVRKPVSQWIVFEDDAMLVWYPESRQAWRFLQKRPQGIGFASMFAGAIRADFGLAEAGFTLSKTELEEGTLVSRWKPPSAIAGAIGAATVRTRDRRPMALEIEDHKGGILARVSYEGFVPFGSAGMPSRVEMVQDKGKSRIVETVAYTDIEFNAVLPQELDRFRLPEGVEAEEHEW